MKRHASGYVRYSDPDMKGKGYIEYETRMCAHCGYHWRYSPGSKNKYGFCLVCMGLTCKKWLCNHGCDVIEKKLDEVERGKRPSFFLTK